MTWSHVQDADATFLNSVFSNLILVFCMKFIKLKYVMRLNYRQPDKLFIRILNLFIKQRAISDKRKTDIIQHCINRCICDAF